MSTSKTYQQSLADAGSETRPPMLERGSYISWASRFRRYINQKRENRKWLNKVLDEGPYQFEMFIPNNSTVPKLQTAEDLQGDELLHYDSEMELMNLILFSIPNDIYNSVDACTSAKHMFDKTDTFDDLFDYLQQFEKLVNVSRAKKLEKSHDHLALCLQLSGKGQYAAIVQLAKSSGTLIEVHHEQMLHAKHEEAGVIHTDEQKYFLFAEASIEGRN
ncbi:hypothetical protein Tco_0271834 [Tanacetum coccineum]